MLLFFLLVLLFSFYVPISISSECGRRISSSRFPCCKCRAEADFSILDVSTDLVKAITGAVAEIKKQSSAYNRIGLPLTFEPTGALKRVSSYAARQEPDSAFASAPACFGLVRSHRSCLADSHRRSGCLANGDRAALRE